MSICFSALSIAFANASMPSMARLISKPTPPGPCARDSSTEESRIFQIAAADAPDASVVFDVRAPSSAELSDVIEDLRSMVEGATI